MSVTECDKMSLSPACRTWSGRDSPPATPSPAPWSAGTGESAPDDGDLVMMMSDYYMTSDLLTHRPLVRRAVSDQLDVPAHIVPHLVPEDHHDMVISILMSMKTMTLTCRGGTLLCLLAAPGCPHRAGG